MIEICEFANMVHNNNQFECYAYLYEGNSKILLKKLVKILKGAVGQK